MRTRLTRIWLAMIALLFLFSQPALPLEPIKIGALYNLTGGMSSIDAPALNGVRLKVAEINRTGGLLGGRWLQLISMDTRTDKQIAVAKAQTMLTLGVIAGIGYSGTDFVLVTAPRFQAQGIPFITSGATNPDLTKRVGKCLFMTAFGDDEQAYAIAEFAYHKLKVRRVAMWTDLSSDFTRTLSHYFRQHFVQLGGKVVLEDTIQDGERHFAEKIGALQAAKLKVQAVFIAGLPSEAGPSVQQIRAAGLNLPILSGDGFDTKLTVTIPGPRLATNIYFANHAFRGEKRPEVLAFIKSYQKMYGHPPENAFAALGYDAVGLLCDAIQRAGTTENKALCRALASTSRYHGVTGTISYSRSDGVPVKPVAIIGVDQGSFHLVEIWFPLK